MKKLIVIASVLCALYSLQAQNFNSKLAAKLQAKFDEQLIANPNTKGMSAGVYVPGQGSWFGTGGISHSGQAITADMKMGLASNSKLFTAVVMLVLAEKNIISLDDKLFKWLPKFKNIDQNVTIRQLLNHTSGIDDMFGTPAQLDSIQKNPLRVWKPEEVLGWIGPMKFAPGASTYYSNTNYIVAGMIAKNATGKHISKLIREYILDPLQLNHTFYDVEESVQGTIAHRWYNSIDYHDTSRISLNTAGGPAGSIFSTPEDMLIWYNKLLSGQVLTANSLAQMTTFMPPANYGMGISRITLLGKILWGHGGITFGYKTRMFYDPCMKVIVCGLSNSNPSAVDGISGLLYKVLLDYLPACAGNISGVATVCQGQNAITYTVPPIANANTYVWTLPNGFIGNSTSNSITINFDYTSVTGVITVKGENEYGQGASSSFMVSVNPTSIAMITPGGATDLCAGNTVELTAGYAAAYFWSTGETTQTITVSKAGNYSLIVENANGCKSLPANIVITAINIPLQPDPIQGPFKEVCAGTVQNYLIPQVNGVQYYWVITSGATIVQGQGSNSVLVSFDSAFTGGKLGVLMINDCGNGPMRHLDITSVPGKPEAILGNVYSNCQSTSVFRIKKVANANNYTWTTDIPGVVITTVPNSSDTAVSIQFPVFTSGNIQVTANNACGSGPASMLAVYGVPPAADKIYGNLAPCVGSIQYYYIAKIPGAIKYNWTVPPGTTILSGATTQVIKVKIGNSGGDIIVNAVNNCGNGGQKKLSITTPCQIQAISNSFITDLTVYPNPTKDVVTIEWNQSGSGIGMLHLENLQGQILETKPMEYFEGNNVYSLDLSKYQPGVYHLIFSNADKTLARLIVRN